MAPSLPPPPQAALLARLQNQALQTRFSPYGVTPAQYQVLQHLWNQDDLTQNTLCGLIGIEQPTMANTLKRMERDGLVRKVQDDNDRRKVRIRLTKRAKDLAETLVRSADEVHALAVLGLTEVELSLVNRLVGRMIANLEQDLAQDPLMLEETMEPAMEPIVEPEDTDEPLETAPEPTTEPVMEPAPEPVMEPAPEPAVEAAMETAMELTMDLAVEPAMELTMDLAVESTPEPAVDAAVDAADTDEPSEPEPAPDGTEEPLLRPVPHEPDLLILDEEVVEPEQAPASQVALPLDLTGSEDTQEEPTEYMLLDEVSEEALDILPDEPQGSDQDPGSRG